MARATRSSGAGAGIANHGPATSSSFFGYWPATSDRPAPATFYQHAGSTLEHDRAASTRSSASGGAANVDDAVQRVFGSPRDPHARADTFFGYHAAARTRRQRQRVLRDEARRSRTRQQPQHRSSDVGRPNSTRPALDNTMVGLERRPARPRRAPARRSWSAIDGSSSTTGHHNTVIGSDANFGSSALRVRDRGRRRRSPSTPATPSPSAATSTSSASTSTLSVGTLGGGRPASGLSQRLGSALHLLIGTPLRRRTSALPARRGLDVVSRLRPVPFQWNDGRRADLGFMAEEVDAGAPARDTDDAGRIEA